LAQDASWLLFLRQSSAQNKKKTMKNTRKESPSSSSLLFLSLASHSLRTSAILLMPEKCFDTTAL
jgi:hypothetical protein